MSQINYNMKIFEALMKKESHLRGLAKIIGTNQTTASRKLAELYNENVVDSRTEGKNKVFFVKKTLEAKQYAYIAESYKLLNLMKKYPALRRIVELIRKNEKISLAILFGSYAKGIAHKESDIDIYLDTEDKKIKQYAEDIDSKVNVKIGKYNKDSLLIMEIEKNHAIIKGVEEYYEKNKFFGQASNYA